MAKELLGADYANFESVTVAATSKALTSGTYGDAQYAFITVETAAVRFTVDGTTVSATIGHILEPGDTLQLNRNSQIAEVRFYRRDGVSATLRVSYGT